MVTSYGTFNFTYGYMEARIWLPGSARIADWPAFWADGQNWPTDGEIDVLEGLSGQACVHFHNSAGGAGPAPAGIPPAGGTPSPLIGSPDRSPLLRRNPDLAGHLGSHSAPMYLILNLALDG